MRILGLPDIFPVVLDESHLELSLEKVSQAVHSAFGYKTFKLDFLPEYRGLAPVLIGFRDFINLECLCQCVVATFGQGESLVLLVVDVCILPQEIIILV